MKALILSCNTGGGHNAAGKAVMEEFLAHGEEAEFLDYLCLAGNEVSKIVGNIYVETVKVAPGLFGFIYKIGMLVSKMLKKSPVYYVNGKMGKYLEEYLENNPVDVILMPHLYPAETITHMKRKGKKLPLTIAIMTDYTCIPFWEETDCDYYMSPHEALTAEIVKRGIPAEKIYPTGIPVSRLCGAEMSRKEARRKLGLSTKKRYILVAGGSMGAGTIVKIVRLLVKKMEASDHVIIICGNNQKIQQKFTERYAGNAGVTVLGYTEHMPVYLKACDIVYTKPGGLTSSEAAVAGIPIVHTRPIPGCETKNRNFFTGNGLSVSAGTCRGQVKKGLELLNDRQKIQIMRENQKKIINSMSAEEIYKLAVNFIRGGNGSV